jgi:cytochrome b subunit of formate dehydrogenase
MNTKPLIKIYKGERYYLKLTGNQRLQHFVLMITFTVCATTGMALKYYYTGWAQKLASLCGGPLNMGMVHKLSGLVMVSLFIYHLYYIGRQLGTLYIRPARTAGEFSFKGLARYIYYSPVFPRLEDLMDIKDMFKYYLFLSDKPPRHQRFYWREKLDYLAVFWGINMLGITGLILWKKGILMPYLPDWAFSIATIAHSFEALLATADIIIWHMYNAHMNYDKFPASPLFLTGYLPESIMKHEYVLEYNRMNKIVDEHPQLVFDEDKWRKDEEARNMERYKEAMEYMDTIERDTREKGGKS